MFFQKCQILNSFEWKIDFVLSLVFVQSRNFSFAQSSESHYLYLNVFIIISPDLLGKTLNCHFEYIISVLMSLFLQNSLILKHHH